MVSHFNKVEIQNLMNEHISMFTTNTFQVGITSGYSFKPMRLVVHQFSPRTEHLVHHHQTRIQSDGEKKTPRTSHRIGAPLGLLGIDMEELQPMCDAHIRSMVENPAYASQSTAGLSTRIPRKLLEIMREYCYETPEKVCIRFRGQ